jgi:putative ABC transport system substrate-binding protein
MKRRGFIVLLGSGVAGWPLDAHAQSATARIQRIGIIDDSPSWDPFRQQLRELHCVEGRNIAYVYLRTDGSPAQLDAAAAALAQLPVNVIAAFGTPGAKAARRATTTIPMLLCSGCANSAGSRKSNDRH